jgi:predicted Zn finger-like uncharacterized protein
MIVTCPQCSSRYKLDPNKVSARGAKITCPRCRYVFVVHADQAGGAVTSNPTLSHGGRRTDAPPETPDLAASAPAAKPPPQGKRSAETLDFRKVGISSWKVRVKIGLVYDFSDIKTLRKYIQDGRVTPEDVISHDASTWVTIGDIPDLDAYFIQIYDEAAEALTRSAESNAPRADAFDDDAPTNVVGLGSLGNDLAAEALAQATAEPPQPPPLAQRPESQHGPQFVDPFAALKDKQRERIQQRRTSSPRTDKPDDPKPKDESGLNIQVLLIAALGLIAVGGGLFWWFGQEPAPPPPLTTQQPDVRGPGQDVIRQRLEDQLKEELEEEIVEGDNPIDDGEPVLIPIGPRGDAGRKVVENTLNPATPESATNGSSTASTVDTAGDCQAFVRQRSWGQAVMACKMAVNANPGNPALKVNYGMALYEQGDAGSAKVQLGGASSGGSTDPRIDKYLGHIARDFGDVPGASSYYQAYLATNPSDKAAIQAELDKLQGA